MLELVSLEEKDYKRLERRITLSPNFDSSSNYYLFTDGGSIYASRNMSSLRSIRKCCSTSLKPFIKGTAVTRGPVSTSNGRYPCSTRFSPRFRFSSLVSLIKISRRLHSSRFPNCTPKGRKTAPSASNCILAGCLSH